MWLVCAPYTGWKGEDFVSCLSYAVVLECSCLLEPLVCCLAELDHVVVVSKLVLALECLLRVDLLTIHLVLRAVDLCVNDDAVLVNYNCSHCC